MSIYKRGGVYWYEFQFQGIRVRDSAKTGNKELALRAERERRRTLELGANALQPIKRPKLFSSAAEEWLNGNPHWEESSREIAVLKVRHLSRRFGKMLLSDIQHQDISAYQRARQRQGMSPRSINMELGALRQILRSNGLWAPLEPLTNFLPEREDVGRALTSDEVRRIHAAAAQSRSRSLPVALLILEQTGMRVKEVRTLKWRQVDLIEKFATVGRSKTKGGDGRLIPFTDEVYSALSTWRALFPSALPDHYVFPSERYGLNGSTGKAEGVRAVWRCDPTRPIGSWKSAWTTCRKIAGVSCRTHDLRHTFVSSLGELGVPDRTIMGLAGHLSKRMLDRYSHTSTLAKRNAIALLGQPSPRSPQKAPQRLQ